MWSILTNSNKRSKALSGFLVAALVSAGVLVNVLYGATAADAQFLRSKSENTGSGNNAADANVTYQKWTDQARQRSLPVKIYWPTDKRYSAPYPVLIFSHGLGGSVEAAPYFGKAMSAAGYICFFVQHPGSDQDVWRSHMMEGKAAVMAALSKQANPQNLIDRDNDIKFVIDELARRNQSASDPLLKNKLDMDKIAMSGHSFGAGTSLAIAGQSYGAGGQKVSPGIDQRVKAAIYLCPPVNLQRLVHGQTYAQIKIPGMLFTGTEDNSPIGDTRAEDRRVPFDEIQAPHQYLVIFNGANHATFGGGMGRGPTKRGTANDGQFNEMTAATAVQFLNAALKNDPAAWQWLDGHGAVDYLGKTAHFERK